MNALKNRLDIIAEYLRNGDDSKGVTKAVAQECLGECMAIAEALGDIAGLVSAVRVKKKGES